MAPWRRWRPSCATSPGPSGGSAPSLPSRRASRWLAGAALLGLTAGLVWLLLPFREPAPMTTTLNAVPLTSYPERELSFCPTARRSPSPGTEPTRGTGTLTSSRSTRSGGPFGPRPIPRRTAARRGRATARGSRFSREKPGGGSEVRVAGPAGGPERRLAEIAGSADPLHGARPPSRASTARSLSTSRDHIAACSARCQDGCGHRRAAPPASFSRAPRAPTRRV